MKKGSASITLSLLVFLLVVGTKPAHAYLDPGTGSLILQGLIAGLAAAAGAVSLYSQKIKAMFFKKKQDNNE
jgi:hypothetical protein